MFFSLTAFSTFLILLLLTGRLREPREIEVQIDSGLCCRSLFSGSPEEYVDYIQIVILDAGVSSVLFSLKSELNESPKVHRI